MINYCCAVREQPLN